MMTKFKMARDYETCMAGLGDLDFARCADVLGLDGRDRELIISFFDRCYRVSPERICDEHGHRPTEAVALVLCRYLANCPSQPLEPGRRMTFRELSGAGPLVASFAANTHKLITSAFARDAGALERAGSRLKGICQTGHRGYDLVMVFQALPRIPLYLQFNAAEDPFPAQCGILFDQSAEGYLDMHSLFVLGTYLAGGLIRHVESTGY